MMRILRIMRNYFFYCGIEKDEYNAIKKDAYVSNFVVWRILHFLIAAVFGVLYICSLHYDLMKSNSWIYMLAFIYSVIAIVLFFYLKKDSIAAQLLIYLTMSLLFLFGCIISLRRPDIPAVSFIAFLLITPMFMIDKPFFMAIELGVASAVFLFWTHSVKSYDVWVIDFGNVIPFTIVGIFLNVIANSLRIKEFVLTRKINIQKDTDDLTGLKNKGAITREINKFLLDESTDKGVLFVMDIDRFKYINDTYGHDTGDDVIRQFGGVLGKMFTCGEIVGRFGGDEFIAFIKNADDSDIAGKIACDIIRETSENVVIADTGNTISLSIGIAIYHGNESNYSEMFKKADIALYEAKADSENRYHLYKE
ncbi:diguanylate cyclase (GGDEF) domain-containing protein [Lachnospiraceae bacterium NE2001]|nr:diguanylate cyclase (GGDEF) domain-containing protein [Lachnospiraceae bacterium NE2001]